MNLRARILVAAVWFLAGAALAASPPDTAPKPPQSDDYLEGSKNMEAKNYARALDAFRKGADKGDARAQNALAAMYLNGLGVPRDTKLALQWLQKAAEQGNDRAQSNLGKMYYNGDGVAQDYKLAMSWLEKSALQGYPIARNHLAAAYLDGKAVPVDLVEVYKWLTLSGNDDAMRNRAILEKKMTPVQITEGQKRASDWQAALNKQPAESQKPAGNTPVRETASPVAASAKASATVGMDSGRADAAGVSRPDPVRRSRSHLDARECLKFEDGAAVRKCAERFR